MRFREIVGSSRIRLFFFLTNMTIFSKSIYVVLSISVQIFPGFALFHCQNSSRDSDRDSYVHASMNITSRMFHVSKAGSQRRV